MMSLTGEQTITIYKMPKYKMKKSNQTVKLGQLIEYDKRNIFLQKSCKESGWKTSSWPPFDFYESFIWDESWCSAV